jgi:hypothetical protein
MRASNLLTFQITIITLLFAAITVEISVKHPEWSPTGLTGLESALPYQMDERIKLLAVPH